MTTVTALDTERLSAPKAVHRLLVTRRDPLTGHYESVGFLDFNGDDYRFSYLRQSVIGPDFRPLPGLRDASRVHTSSQLFPIFAERIISARRPDRQTSLDALALGDGAAPFEILGRSGGRRIGDTIEVLPVPDVEPDGSYVMDFLVHGIRHLDERSQQALARLAPGSRLRLVPEPDNPVDSRAVLVTDDEQVRLGWVPAPLLDVVEQTQDWAVSVLRSNPPTVGFHLRLLVRLQGVLPDGYVPFAGPGWATVG